MIERYNRKFQESIPKAPAYWINPYGKILPIFDDQKHIDQIIKNPEFFSFTLEHLQKIYNSENEVLGSEGKAREKIILNLISRNWIRIRYYDRNDSYTVNVNRLTKNTKNYLYKWAKGMEENGHKYSDVKIDMPNKILNFTIKDIVNDILFNENIEKNLQIILNVKDFPKEV